MANPIKKILYIQHASSLGGSCMSLLYTMQGLDKTRYQPVLALTNKSKSVIDFYKKAGFKPITCSKIILWNHSTVAPRPLYRLSTWIELYNIIRLWKLAKRKTLELVKLIKPDLVHLNSMPLSASAVALAQKHIPFVWHVREPPPSEFLRIRTNIIRRLMLQCPDELIFISNAGRQAWVEGKRGQVIPNFVDFRQFDLSIDKTNIRKRFEISISTPIILYLGALNRIKGIFPLIKALSILKKHLPRFYCLMPGSKYNPPNYLLLNLARKILPLIGWGTTGQRVEKNIVRFGLKENCLLLPFQKNVASLIATCNVLVFPAIKPHFARPIIEASAMAKPVIASKFDVIEVLTQNGKTGLLVEPNNPKLLAKALYDILTNPLKAKQMGDAGYIYAKQEFSAEKNCKKIMKIYDKILKNI